MFKYLIFMSIFYWLINFIFIITINNNSIITVVRAESDVQFVQYCTDYDVVGIPTLARVPDTVLYY